MRDTSARREKIIALLTDQGSVQVPNLSKLFKVSSQTIRSDLNALVELGVATRAYGGAMRAPRLQSSDPESAIAEKLTKNAKLKMAIGKCAAAMVQPGDTVILDAGSTTWHLAQYLPDHEDIAVLSNDLGILNSLSRFERLHVHTLGGSLRRKNMSFYGIHAEQTLREIHVDKVFLGVDGFDLEKGISTHFEPEAQLNRLMCQAATKVIAVMDSSKIGRICMHKIIEVKKLQAIVTDSGINALYREKLAELDVQIFIA